MLWNSAKYTTGIFYLIGGPLIHAFMMMRHHDLYATVDDKAWSLYQQIWSTFVLPNLALLVFLLVLLEIVAGLMMLSSRPKQARRGQLAGMLFNLLLLPFWFFYGIPNLLLVGLHYWLWQDGQSAHNAKLAPIALHR